MSLRSNLLAVALAVTAIPAFAADIMVTDAYARASGPNAKSGAAFMTIENHGTTDDRLIDARSDIAKRVELHTHSQTAEGVMQMQHVPEGFAVPASGTHMLARGGDHVMFMGLNQPMIDGETLSVTLVFENAGEMTIDIPVDLTRAPAKPMAGHATH